MTIAQPFDSARTVLRMVERCGSGVVVVFFAHVLFSVYFWRQTHLPEHWLRVDAELFPWSGSATSWCFHCSIIKSCHVSYFLILTIMAASSYLNQQDIEAKDTCSDAETDNCQCLQVGSRFDR